MPDFDFSSLITDRSQADVDNLQSLMSTPLSDWTAEQLAAFNQAISKGAYNYTDLNRVTACMDYLAGVFQSLGYQVPGYKKVEIPRSTSRLPDGYTELAYIESSGTQYVDTQLSAPNGFRARFRVQFNSLTGMLSGVIGAHNPTAPYGRNLFSASSERYEVGQGDGFYDFGLPSTGKMIQVDFSNAVDNPYCFINDEPIDMVPTVPVSGVFTSKTLFLFAINGGETWYQNLIGRLGEIKLYDDNELARDYIPCKNPSGIIGLYDQVSEEFYGNAGTGEFIAGPEIEEAAPEDLDPYTWYESDIPTASQMAQYIANVAAIRAVMNMPEGTPETPEDMEGLTYEEANDIETILGIIETLINNMAAAWFFSGDLYSGEAEA